jgi:hypothetical protein
LVSCYTGQASASLILLPPSTSRCVIPPWFHCLLTTIGRGQILLQEGEVFVDGPTIFHVFLNVSWTEYSLPAGESPFRLLIVAESGSVSGQVVTVVRRAG